MYFGILKVELHIFRCSESCATYFSVLRNLSYIYVGIPELELHICRYFEMGFGIPKLEPSLACISAYPIMVLTCQINAFRLFVGLDPLIEADWNSANY